MTADTKQDIADEVIDRAEIRDGKALVAYTRTEIALADLRKRHEGAVFDLTTSAGDKAARAARLELVTLRTGLEKKRKEFKAPFLEAGLMIDAEAKRITAEIEKLEKPIDAQIRADEERRERERAEKARLEAERKAKHEAAIAKIRAYATAAAGLPSARIENGIKALEAMTFGDGWQEYAKHAAEARDETSAALREIHAATVAREQEAARLEAQRVEQARIAAEQAERQRVLDEQAKEAARQLAEQQAKIDAQISEAKRQQEEAQRKLDEMAASIAKREAEAAADELRKARETAMQEQALIEAAKAVEVKPPIIEAPAVQAEEATIKLGDLNEALGFTMSEAFIADTLGITPACHHKRSVLFRPSQRALIRDALVAHINKALA